MATFKLSPIQEGLNDKDWVASTYKGECHVGAKDEQEARQFAATEFAMGISFMGGELPTCPWKQPRLTECVEVHSVGTPIPHGMVTTPDDPASFRPAQA